MAGKKNKIKTDEKSDSEDSTGASPLVVQTDEEVGSRSMHNEMAGPFGIADDQTHDKNSSNPGLTAGFSKFANNVDGIANVAQNLGTPSSCARNVDANPSSVKIATEFFGPPQNMHGFGGNMGAGFQWVDSNTRFPAPQFQASQNSPVQTGERDLFPEKIGFKMPYLLPERQGIKIPDLFSKRLGLKMPGQQFPAYQNSSVPTPKDFLFPERKRPRLPGQVMPVASGSGPAQASSVPIGPSHMRDTTQFAPIARPIQRTTRSEKPSTHQSTSESAQFAPSFIPVHQFFPVAPQAQTSASLSPSASFRGPDSQSTTLLSQAQTADPASRLAEEMPSLHVLKGKSAARGSGHAQASNASVGPSLKKNATQRPSIARPDQRRATIQSSVPASVQTAPPLAHQSQIVPVPPQDLTAASCPSFLLIADHLQNLSQSQALPHSLQTVLTDSQIAMDFPQSHASQEGLLLQPGDEPVLLTCGHLYHKHCLQEITPADQTENRPCFGCQNMI